MSQRSEKILVLNAGSSSIKYELFEMVDESSLLSGTVERIGSGEDEGETAQTHERAFESAFEAIADTSDLVAIGHRVVHGGDRFRESVLVDGEVVDALQELLPLAPLHIGPNMIGIEVARRSCPQVPQVAVFDTAFHADLPEYARRYALPRGLAEEYGVHRYGFHGISHSHVSHVAAEYLDRPVDSLDLITLHLGNGASATAVRGGKSVDTSMGFTPLEGLVMGTRSGDLDPAIPLYLRQVAGLTDAQIENILNHESGLLGLCGESDLREVHRLADSGDADAVIALELFCYRVKKYVGAYFAVLGHVDAIVFTGGIGEHDADVRERVVSGLGGMGITIDKTRNLSGAGVPREIQEKDASIKVLVAHSGEELEIARETYKCVTAVDG